MRLTTLRSQTVFHLLMADKFLTGQVDHEQTVTELVAVDTATQHVRAALRALGHDVDLHKQTTGGEIR